MRKIRDPSSETFKNGRTRSETGNTRVTPTTQHNSGEKLVDVYQVEAPERKQRF